MNTDDKAAQDAVQEDAPTSWGRIKLNNTAKEIREGLTDKDWKRIDKAPAMSYALASEALPTAKHASDVELVSFVMSLVKGGVSITQRETLFDLLRKHYAPINKRWTDGAFQLCRARIEGKRRDDAAKERGTNNIAEDGFPEQVEYAAGKLEAANKVSPVSAPTIFRYGTELARIVQVEEEDTATVQVIDRQTFATHISEVAPFCRPYGDSGVIDIAAPEDVVRQLFKSTELPLPYLGGLTRIPTFSNMGKLHMSAGYDEGTSRFYVPPVDLDITIPTLPDAVRLLVEEVFADFPFDGCDRAEIMRRFEAGEALPASLCNALALLIEPLVREMISGPTPGVLISKPDVGTGATHLVEAIQTITMGVRNIRPPLSDNEEERRKVLFTAVQKGEPLVCYDNVVNTIDSPTMAALLTSTTFTDRVLGRTSERSLPVRSTFVFTANNVLFSSELQRRLSLIRLDAQMANPKSRGGWRHADLLGWIERERGKLLGACIAIVRNWVVKGCHGPKLCPAIASYPGWCFVMGGILESAHPALSSFQGNRTEISQVASADAEEQIHDLLRVWYGDGAAVHSVEGDAPEKAGVPVSYLAALCSQKEVELPVALKPKGEACEYNVAALGKYLASFNKRRFELRGASGKLVGIEVEKLGKRSNNATLWVLREHAVEVKESSETDDPGVSRVADSYRSFPLTPRRTRGDRRTENTTTQTSDNVIHVNPFAA